MFNNQVFYFGTIRKIVTVFGDIFNNVHIHRYDDLGVLQKDIIVPISYAPRDRYVAKLKEEYGNTNGVGLETTLPRMSYSLESIDIDPERMLNRVLKITSEDNQQAIRSMLNPIPYNFTFTLDIWTKNISDKLMVLEQVLPFFAPEFNARIITIPEINLSEDVSIELVTTTLNDDYEGVFDSFRVLTGQLVFTVKGFIYPPLSSASIINKVEARLKDIDTNYTIETITTQTNPLPVNESGVYVIEEFIT